MDGFDALILDRMQSPVSVIRLLAEHLIAAGALDATLDLAGDYADAAKTALSLFPANEWREALQSLADFAVSRRA
jgi:octaprenyl-diphosphate synthase